MQNNFQLYAFLLIVSISFLQWAVSKAKEKREIKRINDHRRQQREAAATGEAGAPNALAEQRKERLRQIRKQQAQRTREQINVLTGRNAPTPQPKRPAAPTPVARAQVRRQPPPQPQTRPQPQARPTPVPQRAGARRPVRPGRTARRTPTQAPPAPQTPQRAARPARPAKPATGHSPLPSEALATARTPAATPAVPPVHKINWKQAIVLSEILAPPVSMRPPSDY